MKRLPPHVAARSTPAGQLDEGALHGIVGYQLAQATVATTQVFQATVGGPLDLRPVEFTVLALVLANPGVSAKQLAQALAVTPPNITTWIDRLEQRGLVERERSTVDRRAQHIRATAAGSLRAGEAVAAVLAAEQQALAGLSPAERAMLVELLGKAARCRR